jgi:hypothetical protein
MAFLRRKFNPSSFRSGGRLLLKRLGEGVAAFFDLLLAGILPGLLIESRAKGATAEKNDREQRKG